jgi:type IV pilus assembly protein PilC
LKTALEQRIPPERWISDPELASWLPLVLRYSDRHSERDWNSAQIRELLSPAVGVQFSWLRRWLYPIFVLLATVLVMVFLSVTVLPVFDKMFSEFGLHLPTPTRWVLAVGEGISGRNSVYTGGMLAGIAISFCVLLGASRLLYRWQSITPIGAWLVGRSPQLAAMARWTSTLAELLAIRAPMNEAMRIAGLASRHPLYSERSQQLARELSEPSRTLAQIPVPRCLSRMAWTALTAGHGGQPSVPMLRQVADLYCEQSQAREKERSAMLAPLMIVCLGCIVGLVIIALFMPLISLVTALSN